MPSMAVIVLTRNESIHLGRALESVAPVAKELIVVDSHSTDGTVAIAESYGARVIQHQFVNYARQFQWALDNIMIQSDWIMRLDADEIVEPDLAAEMRRVLPKLPAHISGVCLNRKTIFGGRWIKHGGRYPLLLLRVWRNGVAHIEDRWMDEHMVLTQGRTITCKGGFADHNLKGLGFFIEKHNEYATREAIDVIMRTRAIGPRGKPLTGATTSRQAAFKRALKERVYERLPVEVAAPLYFLLRYFGQLGFLDGRAGLAYHFFQGLWYRFLVGAKVREFSAALADRRGDDAALVLSRLTGYDVKSVPEERRPQNA